MCRIWILIGCVTTILFSCKSYKQQEAEFKDTPDRGVINISVDESFKPIIDEEVKVYESNNSGTKINIQYKPEADCVKDLWNDSIRMVISTFQLTENERTALTDSLKVIVDQLPIARDAIAVIVNNSSKDSVFDMNDIKRILTGTYDYPYTPVFDGVKTTSTIRYVVDSVLRGKSLTNKAKAAQSSDSVINYIVNHPEAIGFVGVSWIGNPDDPQQLSFLKKVKIARLKSNDKEGKYIFPVQANLYGRLYPMTRDLTYILKESYRGLGTGFAEFLRGEIGQLIFKRAYLMPGRRYFIMRPIQLKEDSI